MIDLRSDTVTRPTAAMRRAMFEAEVGDDVFGDDPTVLRLEELAAGITGQEAAVFAASGTQSNLMAMMSHCQRGDEYIVGDRAHTFWFEAGGAAVLGSIQPQTVPFAADGTLPLDAVAAVIKPDDVHFARTRVLCLENTTNGKVVPLAYLDSAVAFARDRGLGLHLDGARIGNAAVASGVPIARVAQGFDTVSVCLSKGLGAPVGTVLCGRADLITDARRWRKMLGGGMRQAGILAAAGIVALTEHVERLAEDHLKAAALALGLRSVPGVEVLEQHTNMVFARVAVDDVAGFKAAMHDKGVVLYMGTPLLRMVTHLDVAAEDIPRVVDAFAAVLGA